MDTLTQIEHEARRIGTHTIVFNDAESKRVVARAMAGFGNQAIADEFGLSQAQVQYRISKAQRSQGDGVRFRRQFRNGQSPLACAVIRATEKRAFAIIARDIAPQFIPLAAHGVSRHV